MHIQPLDLVRWGLSFGGLVVMIFTLGAYVGWRMSSRGERHEPTWLFVLGELSWLPIIGALLLTPFREPLAWVAWLPPIVLVLWTTTLVLRYRDRRRRTEA